jgi:type II secretory pathway component PulF
MIQKGKVHQQGDHNIRNSHPLTKLLRVKIAKRMRIYMMMRMMKRKSYQRRKSKALLKIRPFGGIATKTITSQIQQHI